MSYQIWCVSSQECSVILNSLSSTSLVLFLLLILRGTFLPLSSSGSSLDYFGRERWKKERAYVALVELASLECALSKCVLSDKFIECIERMAELEYAQVGGRVKCGPATSLCALTFSSSRVLLSPVETCQFGRMRLSESEWGVLLAGKADE